MADPFQSLPPFEKLVGDLNGAYSRRITIQDRVVYQVLADEHAVKVSGCGPNTSEAPKMSRSWTITRSARMDEKLKL